MGGDDMNGNGVTTDTPPQAVDVEEHARVVMGLLREYVEKLVVINRDLAECVSGWQQPLLAGDYSQAAWLLDQSELIRKPLLAVLSRGSGLRENASLEPITQDELNLRMVETEVHMHHMMRLTGELRSHIESKKVMDHVGKLRVVAGLSGMKGGPVRP